MAVYEPASLISRHSESAGAVILELPRLQKYEGKTTSDVQGIPSVEILLQWPELSCPISGGDSWRVGHGTCPK